jgi:toxin ParE1/3/4
LDDIWYEIARDSTDAADGMIDRIRVRCQERAAFPLLGERQDHLLPHLRRLIVGPYLVFYFPTGDGLSVLRILHGRRDIDRLFE